MRFLRCVKGCKRRDILRNDDIGRRIELNIYNLNRIKYYKQKWKEYLSRRNKKRIPQLT